MKTPHNIEKQLSRYIDGKLDVSQSKLIQEWETSSPQLQKDIQSQREVSSQLSNTLSNPQLRSNMEATLQNILSTIPHQATHTTESWFAKWFIFPTLSPKAVGFAVVLLCIISVAVLNGPVSPPKIGMAPDASLEGFGSKGSNLFFYLGTDVEIESKTYEETTQTQGISGPPGVASGREFSEDSRFRGAYINESLKGEVDSRSAGRGRAPLTSRYDSSVDGLELNRNGVDRFVQEIPRIQSWGIDFDEDFMVENGTLNTDFGNYFADYKNENDVVGFDTNTNKGTIVGKNILGRSEDNEFLIAQSENGRTEVTNPDERLQTQSEIEQSPQVESNSSNVEPGAESEENESVETGRKIIRNARMNLEVEDVLSTKDRIEEVVEEIKGLVANASVNQDQQTPSVGMTLWIPADALEQMLEELDTLGRALNVEVFTNDITEQYFDMATRVRNLKIQEIRLVQLYEREVEKLEEILSVEREIQRVRTEIEQLEGRRRMWDRQIAFSTIELTIQQEPEKKPIVQSEPDSVFSPLRRVWRDAGAVFLYSLSIMTGITASIISTTIFFIPWLVLLVVIVYIAKWFYTFLIRKFRN